MSLCAYIISDNSAIAARLQASLEGRDIKCPPSNVVSTMLAQELMQGDDFAPDLVFVALPSDSDPTIEILKELGWRTQAKLVAVASARDPSLILKVVHAGTNDFLDSDGDLDEQLDGLIDRMHASMVRHQAADGRLVSVMSSNGGAGRSTIAANVAIALAGIHGECCLCDLDIRRGDLTAMLGLKPRHTIVDLCSNVRKLDWQMFDDSLVQHESGVRLLAAPQSLNDVQPITSDAIEKVMQFARTKFPFVVVDLEDFFHCEQFRVLQLSDVVFLVLRLDFNSLRNTRRTLDYLESIGFDVDKVQLIANQYGRPKELSSEQAEDALEMKIAHYVPDEPKTVIESFNMGVPFVLKNPRSRASRAIKHVAANATETALA